MKIILGITILPILGLFQLSLFPVWFSYTFPNLLLVTALALGFSNFKRESLWAAFLGGLFFDIFAFHTFGLGAFFMVLTVSLTHLAFRFFGRNFALSLVLAFGTSLIFRLGIFLPKLYQGPLFLEAVENTVALILILPLVKWFGERILKKQEIQLKMRV